MRKIISTLIIMLFCITLGLQAQELNCKVTVNSEQIQGTNKSMFEALQKAVTEFMNERPFTEYKYEQKEKIECSLYIIINSYSDNYFSTELQIQANRPVFGSNYKSPIFSYSDKTFNFQYVEGDALNFDLTSFGNNLTEVLAFYAYIIIGTDCDSFSKFGGDYAYRMAEQIVNQAQSTNENGWKAFEDNHNRYALINNILDDVTKPYREYFYTYHRLGLDQMHKSADNSRAIIVEGMPVLKSCYKARPSMIIISEFADTKSQEIVNILSRGSTDERKQVYDIMSYVAPTSNDMLDSLK